jgi:hypothetical protein
LNLRHGSDSNTRDPISRQNAAHFSGSVAVSIGFDYRANLNTWTDGGSKDAKVKGRGMLSYEVFD